MESQWKIKAQTDVDSHGVCDEYSNLVRRAKTEDDALLLYRRGIDWCLERNSPSLSLLREHKEACERNGIFLDCTFHGELLNDNMVYIFHNCKGTINVDLNVEKKIIPMLYFANGCEITIRRCEDSNISTIFVPIYIFGANKITTENTDFVQFKIFKENDKSQIKDR